MSEAMAPGLSIDLDAISRACHANEVESLDLFGSAATGRFDPERSDIDLIVAFVSADALGRRFFDFHQEMERMFGRHVDLITERALRNPYFRRQVQRQRRRLYPLP